MATAVGYPPHPRTTEPHGWHHAHGSGHLVIAGCAITGLVLVCNGHLPGGAPSESSIASASWVSAVNPATDATAAARAESARAIAGLQAGVATARAVVDEAAGRVLDDTVRTELLDRIQQSEEAVRSAQLLTAIAEPGTVAGEVGADADEQVALTASLHADVADVERAVAAWEAEQARIAAEREAARRAAEAAAAAAARAQPRVSGARVAVAPGPYVEGIWTSGGQAQIDACRGSVNMPDVAGYLGGSFYAAEHWSCGGRAWAGIGTGALVSFPGYGIYQVAGRVGGLPSGSSASSVPSGYDGYYQTCMNGDVNNLFVWLLTRVA